MGSSTVAFTRAAGGASSAVARCRGAGVGWGVRAIWRGCVAALGLAACGAERGVAAGPVAAEPVVAEPVVREVTWLKGQLLARVVGPGRGLEIVSSVNDIPKGSRLAVSTNLLGSLISVCMRATSQAVSLTGSLQEDAATGTPAVVVAATDPDADDVLT